MEGAIVADIGGTWIRVGPVQTSTPTPSFVERTPDRLEAALDVLSRGVRQTVQDRPQTYWVFVGIGGLVQWDGLVRASIHTPFSGLNLKTFLRDTHGLDAWVENDVNFQFRGLPISKRITLLISVGTGMGGAAGLAGRPLPDASGFGGEFGHAFFGFGHECCPCGRQGCIDLWLSGRRREDRLGHAWFERLADVDVAEDLARSAGHLAPVLTSLLRAYDPYAVFFGGSLFQTVQMHDCIRQCVEAHWSKTRTFFVRDNWAVGLKAARRLAFHLPQKRSHP